MENQPTTAPATLTLEQRIENIEKDLNWQKVIHRNVGPDGNIYHYWDILPIIAAASGIGVIVGIVITRVFK